MSVRRLGFAAVLGLASVSCSARTASPPLPPAPAVESPAIAERPVRVAPSATPAAAPAKPVSVKKTAPRAATLDVALSEFAARDKARIAPHERVIEMVDLNGDGAKEAIVLLRSRRYCSARGCTLLVYQQVRGGYELHSRFLLGRTPMIATHRSTAGWRDLAAPMTSARTGMRLVMLRHGLDGYPADAENLAAIPPTQSIRGEVLFSDD